MHETLKPGYKQTEVGVIPKDWRLVRLDELTDPARPIGYGIVQTGPNVFGGVSCLRVVDIVEGKIDQSDLITTSEQISQAYKRTILRPDDLVIALRGKLGAVAKIGESLAGSNLTRGVALLSTSNYYFPDYLRFFLSSTIGKSLVEKNFNGSALQEIPIASLRGLPIPVPPLHEQRAIAEALSDADAWIAGLEAVIAKKRDLKQAVMQKLLSGKTRLPGFSGEWEVKRLGEIFELTMAGSKSNYVEDAGTFWIVDMGSVTRDGRLSVTKPTNISADMLYKGDLVMPKDDIGGGNIIGRVGYIDKSKKYVCGDHVYRLSIKAGSSKFFCYLINSDPINKALRKKVVGSAQLGLGRKSVLEQELAFPSLVEQSAIAELLSDMDAELAALDAEAQKARTIKQGMMQKLLTGKVRLV